MATENPKSWRAGDRRRGRVRNHVERKDDEGRAAHRHNRNVAEIPGAENALDDEAEHPRPHQQQPAVNNP